MIPSKLLEFSRNEALRSAYAAAYYSPEMQFAIAEVKALKEPRPVPAPEGVDFTVWQAHVNALREGFFEAFALLEMLAKPVQQVGDSPDRRIMPNLVDEDNYTE